MRVRVVTDSSSSVPDEYLAQLEIAEALATVNFGQRSYLAKVEITPEDFYARLATADLLPTTSQPTPKQFAEAYARLAAEGADEVVAVCVSSQLSGTLNSAVIAAEHAPLPVRVWDSRHASIAAGFQAIAAGELAQAGHDSQTILDALAGIRSRMQMVFVPANLRYLVASGRAPKLRGAVGDFLNIKPVLTTIAGRLEVYAQVRGHNRALETMLDRLSAAFGSRRARVAVGHCNVLGEAERCVEMVRSRFNVSEVMLFDLGPVLASLGGPGLIGFGGYALEE